MGQDFAAIRGVIGAGIWARVLLVSSGCLVGLSGVGCGDSSGGSATTQNPPPELDTSYLEGLERERLAGEAAQEEQETTALAGGPEPEAGSDAGSAGAGSEDRELVAARQSQSALGRTRDMARDVRNALSGGAASGGAVAETSPDEHYVRVDQLAWDVPEDWQIIIPSDEAIRGEIRIGSKLGNASAVFSEADTSVATVLRRWSGQVLDFVGDPVRLRPTERQIAGYTVHVVSASGTMVVPDDSGVQREHPFWALRGAIVERPGEELVLAILFGPEDTVRMADALWTEMIERMYEL